ncbi:hypothetical protein [Thalassotalea sediminis]|uniref:hypothetical protein n=1 Tax=Thalassotalea sediminis TaxID=1759089 RepID=UPI002573A2DE|nr:hypothetical protein [Thalassotalea sediminis]
MIKELLSVTLYLVALTIPCYANNIFASFEYTNNSHIPKLIVESNKDHYSNVYRIAKLYPINQNPSLLDIAGSHVTAFTKQEICNNPMSITLLHYLRGAVTIDNKHPVKIAIDRKLQTISPQCNSYTFHQYFKLRNQLLSIIPAKVRPNNDFDIKTIDKRESSISSEQAENLAATTGTLIKTAYKILDLQFSTDTQFERTINEKAFYTASIKDLAKKQYGYVALKSILQTFLLSTIAENQLAIINKKQLALALFILADAYNLQLPRNDALYYMVVWRIIPDLVDAKLLNNYIIKRGKNIYLL